MFIVDVFFCFNNVPRIRVNVGNGYSGRFNLSNRSRSRGHETPSDRSPGPSQIPISDERRAKLPPSRPFSAGGGAGVRVKATSPEPRRARYVSGIRGAPLYGRE
ncbi:unnamed protein product, partial [Iphiclides podalirius]